jgi:CDP-diglyceride synthetase
VDRQDEDRSAQADEPTTERVRIVGAQPAAELAGGQSPGSGAPWGDEGSGQVEPGQAEGEAESGTEWREQHYLGFVHRAAAPPPPPPPPVPPVSAPPEPGPAAVPPELQHWADPPTGQVPAVLDRRSDEDEEAAWAAFADSGPVWREHEHEWADSGGFEPAMLADDETRVGALDESPVEERRPWEFDDLTPTGGTQAVDEGTEPRPEGPGAAPAREHRTSDFPSEMSGGSWWDDEADTPRASDPGETLGLGPPHTSGRPPEATEPTLLSTSGPPSVPSRTADEPVTAGDEVHVRRATAGSRSARSADSPAPGRNVPLAVGTGIGIAAVVLGCLAGGPLPTMVLATVMVTLAAAEAYASFRRAGMRPATLLGLVATVAVMVAAYDKGIAALPLVTVLVVVAAMVWYLLGAEHGSAIEGISATLLGFGWVALLGSFAALMLAPSIYPHRHGVAFAFGAVVATVAADVGALAVGSWLGRHQLAPHVSPNKTWEGWAGGAVLAVAASVLITGRMHPWTPGKAAVLGVMVAVVAPLGDLCESLIKRSLGLKDMGSLLPGHGGVLDRMDALLFVLPATYYLVRVLNLG